MKKLKQQRDVQRYYYDQHTKEQTELRPGDAVRVQNFNTKKWDKQAVVIRKCSQLPRSYLIKTERDQVLRRNRRHLLKILKPEKKLINTQQSTVIKKSKPNILMDSDDSSEEEIESTEPIIENKDLDQTLSPRKISRFGRIIKRPNRLVL